MIVSEDHQMKLVESNIVDIWGSPATDDKLVLHSEWKGDFTPSTYEIGLSILNHLKVWAKEKEYSKLVTLIKHDDLKGQKYVSMFGFAPDGAAYENEQGLFVEYTMDLTE